MRIGINWTSLRDSDFIFLLKNKGEIDFVEVLIDNFLHLDPCQIKEELKDIPVAFHIMSSKFLTANLFKLKKLAELIKVWIEILNPIYVSDHLGLMEMNGNLTPILVEVNYNTEKKKLFEKIVIWQNLLGVNLHLENYPSYISLGHHQVDFFNLLEKKTGVTPLFDISNSLVAQKNIGVPSYDWNPIALKAKHFHCGSFKEMEGRGKVFPKPLHLDSHDTFINSELSQLVKRFLGKREDDITLTMERDLGREYQNWSLDKEVLNDKRVL